MTIWDAQHDVRIPKDEWAVVTPGGDILCATGIRGSEREWAYAIAHCVLHLCLDHFRPHPDQRAWNFGCDAVVSRFLASVGLGAPPPPHRIDFPPLPRDEEAIYRELTVRGGVPEHYRPDLLFEEWGHDDYDDPVDYPKLFTAALREAVGEAMRIASGVEPHDAARNADARSLAEQARSWFMASYPLLGALAASFELIQDMDTCRALDIDIAAVCAADKTIYINPLAGLDPDEMKFVVAHEILHAALRHDQRAESRDFFLWNCATDYTINLWLVEMGIGQPPYGLLLDEQLRGMSSEEVYDRITGDLRVQRRLRRAASFAGRGKPDMIGRKSEEWWLRGAGCTLDDFYRSALAQGLDLHQREGRGLLPAALVEEIRAQTMPPIPWDVRLAQWLDRFFPIPEYRRSYARPSRRQSSTPDIPRPRAAPREGWQDGRTFGVVLDTSGSMDAVTLARGLGTVAAYCASREVPAVRVVFCDAAAYDAGYLTPEEISGRVRVRGRGGTILQPGVDRLMKADDFPPDGPILIITDTYCEPNLHVRREHAFLIPFGQRLPFPPRGPVFTMPPAKSEA